jgi:putative chitinase
MTESLPKLANGDRGPSVKKLQRTLSNWGILDPKEIDGIFGQVTEGAVKAFQMRRDKPENCQYADQKPLEINGKVDKNDWQELLKTKDVEIVDIVELVTETQIEQIMGNPVYNNELADLNRCLKDFDITTPERIRQFLAQCAHESGGMRWLKELSDGWYLEHRADLGNTQPGDGPKFKGAGVIQLTGRSNYTALAQFVNDPKIIEIGCDYVAQNYPFTSAGFWWKNNDMNSYVDQGATCRQVSARVNGCDPANGLDDRQYYYTKACQVIPG